MADNITIVTADGVEVQLATREIDGVHYPYHMDGSPWGTLYHLVSADTPTVISGNEEDGPNLITIGTFKLPTAPVAILGSYHLNVVSFSDPTSPGLSLLFEWSLDGTSWHDDGSSFANMTAPGYMLNTIPSALYGPYFRVYYLASPTDNTAGWGVETVTWSFDLLIDAEQVS